MSQDTAIHYNYLIYSAYLGIVQKILTKLQRSGPIGKHHFFFTINTMHPRLQIPQWLLAKYNHSITIVLQHAFENLEVYDEYFNVTLRFGGVPASLSIPFTALLRFEDPHAGVVLEFGRMSQDAAENASNPSGEAGLTYVPLSRVSDNSHPNHTLTPKHINMDVTPLNVASQHRHDESAPSRVDADPKQSASEESTENQTDAPTHGNVIELDKFRPRLRPQ